MGQVIVLTKEAVFIATHQSALQSIVHSLMIPCSYGAKIGQSTPLSQNCSTSSGGGTKTVITVAALADMVKVFFSVSLFALDRADKSRISIKRHSRRKSSDYVFTSMRI